MPAFSISLNTRPTFSKCSAYQTANDFQGYPGVEIVASTLRLLAANLGDSFSVGNRARKVRVDTEELAYELVVYSKK